MGTGGQVSMLSVSILQKDGIEARPFLGGSIYLQGHPVRRPAPMHFLKNFFSFAGGLRAGKTVMISWNALPGRQTKNCQRNPWRDVLKIRTTFQGTRQNPKKAEALRICGMTILLRSAWHMVLEAWAWNCMRCTETIKRGTGAYGPASGRSRKWPAKESVLMEIPKELFGTELVLASCEKKRQQRRHLAAVWQEFHSRRD